MSLGYDGNRGDVVESSGSTGQISIATTETEIKVGGSRLSGRQAILVWNASAVTIWLGFTGVTTSIGIPLEKGEKMMLPVGDIAYYGRVASGTASLNVTEFA